VPGNEGIAGIETADQLARTGSVHPFIGPEPACGISVEVTKKAIRDWTNKNHKKYWESLLMNVRGVGHNPLLAQRPSMICCASPLISSLLILHFE
jgi:hypothetical protein